MKLDDFQKLDEYLTQKKWKGADLETNNLMLKIMNREKQGYLREDDCKDFPTEELRIIDQLWLRYSQGRFGFSVQKTIWLILGGKLTDYDYNTYVKLAEEVGWRIGGEWLYYGKLTFTSWAPTGHLPSPFVFAWRGRVALREEKGGGNFPFFFSKL
jgi:hypothetical protein